MPTVRCEQSAVQAWELAGRLSPDLVAPPRGYSEVTVRPADLLTGDEHRTSSLGLLLQITPNFVA